MDLNGNLTFCSHALFLQIVDAAIMVRLTTELIVKYRNHVKSKRGLSSQEYLRIVTHLHLSNKNIEDIVSIHYLNPVFSFNFYVCLIFFFRVISLFAGTLLSSTFMTTKSRIYAT